MGGMASGCGGWDSGLPVQIFVGVVGVVSLQETLNPKPCLHHFVVTLC